MAASEWGSGPASLSLVQLVALNDELEALIRADIPLERGLRAASGEYRGRLGQAFQQLRQRLAAGERLPEAIAQASGSMPDVYRAIIEAGMRTGRLADALQGLSQVGQAVVEARRMIILACFYPMLVVTLAYTFFLCFVVSLFPHFTAVSTTFRVDESRIIIWLERAGHSATIWGPVPPALVLALLVLWGQTGRSRSLDGTTGLSVLAGRLPWVGRIIANYRASHFIDLLAHLVAHEVPLDQAVSLAGNAVGHPAFRQTTARYAASLATGETPAVDHWETPAGFSPLVAWIIASGHRQGELAAGLRHLAAGYRRKADRQAEALRILLPGLLVVVVGSVAVLAYGLLLFLPLRQLWDGLAIPSNR